MIIALTYIVRDEDKRPVGRHPAGSTLVDTDRMLDKTLRREIHNRIESYDEEYPRYRVATVPVFSDITEIEMLEAISGARVTPPAEVDRVVILYVKHH